MRPLRPGGSSGRDPTVAAAALPGWAERSERYAPGSFSTCANKKINIERELRVGTGRAGDDSRPAQANSPDRGTPMSTDQDQDQDQDQFSGPDGAPVRLRSVPNDLPPHPLTLDFTPLPGHPQWPLRTVPPAVWDTGGWQFNEKLWDPTLYALQLLQDSNHSACTTPFGAETYASSWASGSGIPRREAGPSPCVFEWRKRHAPDRTPQMST